MHDNSGEVTKAMYDLTGRKRPCNSQPSIPFFFFEGRQQYFVFGNLCLHANSKHKRVCLPSRRVLANILYIYAMFLEFRFAIFIFFTLVDLHCKRLTK